MTDDQYETLAASTVAHEFILKMLIVNLLDPMPGQWRELIEAVLKMPEIPIPAGIARDFESADRLAGVALGVKENMQRIVTEARDLARMRGGSV